MSTNSNCEFTETKPGVWYYVLEHYNAPKNAWDWREYATAYGPFKTEDEAHTHLSNNHANPGGYNIQTYEEGYEPDAIMRELIANAKKSTGFSSKGIGAYLYIR
jgi:hypothetical protein